MIRTVLPLTALLATSAAGAQVPPLAPMQPMPGTPSTRAPATPPATGGPAPGASATPGKAPLPRGAILEEVAGSVRQIDRKAHKLSVETASGAVTRARQSAPAGCRGILTGRSRHPEMSAARLSALLA
jgi:hypothetical protein